MEKKKDSFFLPEKKGKASKPENLKDKPYLKNKQQRQENFDKNRDISHKDKEEKKPFDKKAYRLKKYSKKYKLEQWEEQRKKKMLHNYHQEIKNDPVFGSYKPKTFDEDVTDSEQKVGQFVRHPDLVKDEKNKIKDNKDSYGKAKEHLNKLKQEKLEKQQEKEKVREEKRQKIQEYKKKKNERFKKLSKKTKKGQPVMTGRLELLLEKIQNSK